jgi:iron complex transport system substrate-binding protein
MRTRPWAMATAALVAVAACGGGEADPTTTVGAAEPTTTAAPADPTTSATAEEATSTADSSAIPEGRGVVTENEDGTRTVTWATGSAVVPADPQRIVTVIGDIDLESLLALGITPVGSGTQDGTVEGGYAPHLEELTADVERLAWGDGVPFETIAALEPDLIFSWDEHDTLSEIAPAVPSGSWIGPEWREDFLYIADVVGERAKAEEILGELDGRIEDISSQISAESEGRTAASAQVAWDHSQVYLEPADAFASSLLSDLGLELAPIVADTSGDMVGLSFERLDDLDANIVFWQVRQGDGGAPDEEGLALATESALWETLPAVQEDSVYFVENRPWYFPTILSATQVVDDVEAALVER